MFGLVRRGKYRYEDHVGAITKRGEEACDGVSYIH